MTVTANTTRNQYSAGNQQNTYAYTFQIHDASDLKVYIGDELKSLNTHYTVTGVGSGTGGNVVFDLGVDGNGDPIYIPENTVVSIFLAMDLDRDTNYQPSGAFLAADVNNDFDRLWIASNQQQTDINRSVRLQDTDADASMVLPKIADRADKLLGFSSVLSGATPVTINNNYAQWNSAYDNMITGMQLPSSGILRLSQQDGSDYTVDLDSRYHNIGIDIPDADISESSVTQHRTAMLDIPNNVKAKFGNGDELEIYYDGTTSVIKESGDGNLAILGDFLFLGNPDGTKNYFTAQDGTGVGLYHNGTIKFNTSAAGITVSGTIQATGYNDTNWNTAYNDKINAVSFSSLDNTLTLTQQDGSTLTTIINGSLTGGGETLAQTLAIGNTTGGNDISFGDNDKAKFGASDDLQIYHTGTNSILKSLTGEFLLQGNGITLRGHTPTETMLTADVNGAVTLHYDSLEKLATTSAGIDVTGNLDINGNSGTVLKIGDNTNNVAKGIEFLSDINTDAFIKLTGSSGTLEISSGRNASWGGEVVFSTDTAERMRVASSGNVGIGTSSPNSKLELSSATGSATISPTELRITSSTQASDWSTTDSWGVLAFHSRDTSGNGAGNLAEITANMENSVGGFASIDFTLQNPASSYAHTSWLKLRNSASVENRFVEIKADGGLYVENNVGIGTSSPDKPLTVSSSGTQVRLYDSDGTNQFTDISNDNGQAVITARNDTTNGTIAFKKYDGTSVTESMRIDSSGSVGIGTSSPSTFNVSNGAGNLVVGSGSGAEGITVYSGTTSNGALCFADGTSSTDTYKGYVQYNHNTNSMQFATGHTERMRIDSSGNVLVGKTATASTTVGAEIRPEGRIFGTTDGQFPLLLNRKTSDGDIAVFRKDGTTVGTIGTIGGDSYFEHNGTGIRLWDGNEAITPCGANGATADGTRSLGASAARFKDLFLSGGVKGNTLTLSGDGSSEHARIDSSGNVGIGTTSPSSLLHVNGTARATTLRGGSGTNSAPGIAFINSTTSGFTNPSLATVGFVTGGNERARINSSGQLLVGTTSGGSYNAKIRASARIEGTGFVGTSNFSQFEQGGFMGGATITVKSWTGYSSSSQKLVSFQGSTGSERGTITMAGTSTQYNTTSDERAKENIQDAGDAGAKIDAIQIRQFDWKEDGVHQDFGVIAQELQSVAPEAVTQGFDEEDMWSVDYSKLVPTLIKEIQSLRNRVAQLENEE